MMSRYRQAVIALLLGAFTATPPALAAEFDGSKISNTFLGDAYYAYLYGNHFQSMAMLMAADKQGRLGDDRDLARLFLAGDFARLGLLESAIDNYTRLAGETNVSQGVRDTAWLERAKLELEMGRVEAALKSLAQIKRKLNQAQQDDYASTRARALLETGRQQEALAALQEISEESTWALYQLFNIGVDLIDKHHDKNGALILHKIGRLPQTTDKEIQAIQDQANLALGYSLLKINKPARARGYLEKVHLDSHLSNIALLGMGWSYSKEGNYEKALVYWMELEKRPYDSAYGYETLLAVPYALAKAGAYSQALEHYQTALNKVDADIKDMDSVKQTINSGLFTNLISALPRQETGWLDYWLDNPKAPEKRFLPLLLDNPGFQAALREYRELLELQSHQDALKARTGELERRAHGSQTPADIARLQLRYQTLAQQTEAALDHQLTLLRQVALSTLSRYQAQLNSYVDQIKFGMAQTIEGGTFKSEEER